MKDPIRELQTPEDWAEAEARFNNLEFVRRLGVTVSLANPDEPHCEILDIEPFHLGGIGQDFVNGVIISGVLDLALGLTGLRYSHLGYFATRNLQIDLTLPVEKDGFYIKSRVTSKIGKQVFAEATVFNPAGKPRVHATGVVRVGIRRS